MRGGDRGSGGRALPSPPDGGTPVIWHDVECGAYAADLGLWRELADQAAGPLLDLGCGSGRVGLHLAQGGHRVQGLDLDPSLVDAFNERARGLAAQAEVGDARDFELSGEFGLAIAPMQLLQLFGSAGERIACLSCAASHLTPGGRLALAIVTEILGGTNGTGANTDPHAIAGPYAIPDAREVDGWVYSSLPLETVVGDGEIVLRRLRQTVSPAGELDDALDEVRLRVLSADTVEGEARGAGLRPAGRRQVAATADHVGSTVIVLEREA